MNAESAPQGAPSDLGEEVDDQSIEEVGHGPGAWGKVPRYVATMPLSKDALRLFVMLSTYADGASRLAWPSQETLAKELGWITHSTGRTDRYRISKAIGGLLEADVIRKAGRHPIGDRSWTWRFLVAPFPVDDAYEGYATSNGQRATEVLDDAYEKGLTMRMNPVDDAVLGYAQTDPSNRPVVEQKTHAHQDEKHERQERDQDTSNPWASLPGRRSTDAA